MDAVREHLMRLSSEEESFDASREHREEGLRSPTALVTLAALGRPSVFCPPAGWTFLFLWKQGSLSHSFLGLCPSAWSFLPKRLLSLDNLEERKKRRRE